MINKSEHSDKRPAKQGAGAAIGEPNRIGASTPYDFSGRNPTAYGGVLPVATMLEELGFQSLVDETLTIRRLTRAMAVYQLVLAMVLAQYIGVARLNHLRFLEREPKAVDWKRSRQTEADGQCEFRYQPEGWSRARRFIAPRYQKKAKPRPVEEPEQ